MIASAIRRAVFSFSRVDIGIQEHDADHLDATGEEAFHALADVVLVDRDHDLAGAHVGLHEIAAARDALADADDVARINHRARVLVQLLMQDFGLGLAKIGEPAFHDAYMFEPTRHQKAYLAAGAGEKRVQHAGAGVDGDGSLAVHVRRFQPQGQRRVFDGFEVARRLVFPVRQRLADREVAIRLDEDRVRHRSACVKREDVIFSVPRRTR